MSSDRATISLIMVFLSDAGLQSMLIPKKIKKMKVGKIRPCYRSL